MHCAAEGETDKLDGEGEEDADWLMAEIGKRESRQKEGRRECAVNANRESATLALCPAPSLFW